MKDIKYINIGVVKNIIIDNCLYVVSLDNNISSNVPLDHPIRETYINNEIRFPHFKNDAVALVSYENGMSDWLPARIAVSILGGEIRIGKNNYKFQDTTYEQCMELILQAKQEGSSDQYGEIAILPVPSPYRLHLDEQFSEHNFNIIKETMIRPAKDTHIDLAYRYSKKIGYSIVYVQPTRFTLKYCQGAGIRTN